MTRNTGRTRSMLAGIPLALKGNWALKGVPMNTQRTGLLRDHTPSWTAAVVCAALILFHRLHACIFRADILLSSAPGCMQMRLPDWCRWRGW